MYMQQKTNIAICKPFLLVFFGFDIKNYQELDVNVGEYVTYYYWMKKGEKIIITKQSREQYK